jgi:uroporphyrinogen-III synthase
MGRRVLVTRPEPGASATAGRLAELGFEPVVLPLTVIEPVRPGPLPDRIDAVIATSANAFRHAPPALPARLAGRPLYVVGEKTAIAAGRPVDMVAPDAQGLAERLIERLEPASRILYLAGRVRGTLLEDRLRQAGHRVTAVEVYDAVPAPLEPAEIGTKLGTAPFWSALVYSQRGGEILGEIVAQAPVSFDSTVFVCISREAGAGLREQRLAVADTPDEAGIFEALARLG